MLSYPKMVWTSHSLWLLGRTLWRAQYAVSLPFACDSNFWLSVFGVASNEDGSKDFDTYTLPYVLCERATEWS
jgi:hypothetical protein